jgi:hypothetical protein
LKISDRGGMLCPWVRFLGFSGGLGWFDSSLQVCDVDAKRGRTFLVQGILVMVAFAAIHAARDNSKRGKVIWMLCYLINILRTPSFRLAPNVVLIYYIAGTRRCVRRTLTINQKHTFIHYNVNLKYRKYFNVYSVSMGLASRGDFSRAKNPSARAAPAHPPDPQKPRFWACQKVVPPPCKNVQKMGFLGEKACIFGQFVHNFAQKW